ncbi:MAG: hypothetical protein IJS08_04805 [Victivallales bacterium]|nr:hypothetical protein [Victivallales bacterium]
MELFTDIIEAFDAQPHFRFVVFGASNTERYMPCIHWADVLEVCLRGRFGRKFQMVNAGVSGNNTREALARFDRDVALFKPACVVITFGGNDCNPAPEKNVPYDAFEANMTEIVRKVRALDAIPVLQTYYAMDYSEINSIRAETFKKNMDIVRLVAQKENVHLVDQNALFAKAGNIVLRHKLLLNAMHVNQLGNMLIGVELAMHFDCHPEAIVENDALLPAIALHKKLQEC